MIFASENAIVYFEVFFFKNPSCAIAHCCSINSVSCLQVVLPQSTALMLHGVRYSCCDMTTVVPYSYFLLCALVFTGVSYRCS